MIDYSFEKEIELLQDLIRIPSVKNVPTSTAPFGEATADALKVALDFMAKNGFSVSSYNNYYGYAEIGTGELFGILAHLDVVPEGGVWEYPPFGAEIHDGAIFGRGAEDDKGPAVAAIFATLKLLAEGRTPKKRLRFIFGLDEESGWGCMEEYKKREEMPALGFSPDADFPVINCEKGLVHHTIKVDCPKGIYDFKAGSRANVVPDFATATVDYDKLVESLAKSVGVSVKVNGERMTLTAKGKAAHASSPEQGTNALTLLLGSLGIKYTIFNRLYAAFSDTTGAGAKLNLWDEISGALTLNLGTATLTDGKLIFELDIRFPISYKKEQITELLKGEFPEAEIVMTHHHLPLYVAPDHPLIKTLLEAYDSVMGTKSQPITIGGGTYARMLPVGVAFGACFPGKPSTIHQVNEHISLDDLKTVTEIYYRAIKALVFD